MKTSGPRFKVDRMGGVGKEGREDKGWKRKEEKIVVGRGREERVEDGRGGLPLPKLCQRPFSASDETTISVTILVNTDPARKNVIRVCSILYITVISVNADQSEYFPGGFKKQHQLNDK